MKQPIKYLRDLPLSFIRFRKGIVFGFGRLFGKRCNCRLANILPMVKLFKIAVCGYKRKENDVDVLGPILRCSLLNVYMYKYIIFCM